MGMKTLPIILVLVSMYLVTYFYKIATDVFFYYIQVISYLSVIALTWSTVRDYFKYTPLIQVISLFTLSYLSIYMVLGIWAGFGMTPYSTSLLGILVNIIHVASRTLALEFLRAYAVDKLRYTHRSLAVYLPALITWSLTWFPYPLLSLSTSIESLKTTYRYLIPSLLANMFSTFIVLNHGLTPSVIYNLVPQLFIRITPFLPRLDWLIEGSFNAIVPLIGYCATLPYSRVKRRHDVRSVRVEVKSTSRLIAYFSLVVALILISGGYFGIRLLAISSGSMEPALKVGDVVAVCNYCRDISVGDIVAYASKWGVVVHRVVDIDEKKGFIITKGDANREPDLEPVRLDNVIGKVVFNIPLLGYVSLHLRKILADAFQSSLLILPAILGLIVLYLIRVKHHRVLWV